MYIKKIVPLSFFLSLALLSCTIIEYKKISKEEYFTQIKATWIGQIIGVGWSEPTEFKFGGKIIPFDVVPEYDSDSVNAFGQDDIYVEMTFIISMRCGRDSDCNPSKAAGVLFASLGMEDINKNYYEKLNYKTKFAYTDYNFTELIQTCTKFTEQFILKSKGKIVPGKDGKTYYYIPEKAIIPSAFERSCEPGSYDSTNRLSDEELERINYYSAKHYKKYLHEWIPSTWKISHSAKSDKELSTT